MTLLFLAEPGLSATRCSGLGLKRPERNARRWRLWFCQWIYEEKAPRHALCRFATHVETRSAPKFGIWQHCATTRAFGKYRPFRRFQGPSRLEHALQPHRVRARAPRPPGGPV